MLRVYFIDTLFNMPESYWMKRFIDNNSRIQDTVFESLGRATKRILARVYFWTWKAHEVPPLDISCPDANASYQVFSSSRFFETGAKSAWRCVPKHLPPSQPEPLIFCMTSDSRNTSFVIECCKQDFCNQDLKPMLHPSKEGIVQTNLGVTKNSAGGTGFCCYSPFSPSLYLVFFFSSSLIITL